MRDEAFEELCDKIKEANNIYEVALEEGVVFTETSGERRKGSSPFSEDKHPSFFVWLDKQSWYDYSTSQGGDVFSLV